MIRRDVKQGSEEWNFLRLGKPTASVFDMIVTPKGALSKQSEKLMHRLLAERLLGYPLEGITTAAMEAGKYREPEARNWYAFEKGVEVELAGICFTNDERIGASPDAYVGGNGLLELKCPMPNTHVGYLLKRGIQDDYMPQIQGQLYVCEADWLDSVSYCPPLPPSCVRVHRDEQYIRTLADALKAFCDVLDEAERRLREMQGEIAPAAVSQNQQVWDNWRPTL